MDKSKTVLTIKLKLFKPGKRKCEILDEAMRNYTMACQFLLNEAEKNFETIERACSLDTGRKRLWASGLTAWMDKDICKQLNKFQVEPFKDSIKIDAGSMLATYVAAKQRDPRAAFPEVCGENNLRPIFFCRYAVNRNYSILYNQKTGKYYAKIYLMNGKHEKRPETAPMPDKELAYICNEHSMFDEKIGKKSYLMFPLAFGKWQEGYLQRAIQQPDILKTARLVKEDTGYYLAVNLVFDKPLRDEPHRYMGVSRGIRNLINYSIVDGNGSPQIQSSIQASDDNNSESCLHKVANTLVSIANEHQCKVIVEKLGDRNDGLWFQDKTGRTHSPAMSSGSYNRLCKLLDYKLGAVGLPDPVRASALNLFCTCTSCGMVSRANRFSSDLIICTSCGATIDVERAGSEILARRLLKYKEYKVRIQVEETNDGVRFRNNDLGLSFAPKNPYDCIKEFSEHLSRLMESFHKNIVMESTQPNFRKKYSLIKKLESASDMISMIRLES